MAAVMSNLPLCYMNLNEFPRALEMYRKARQHCEQKGMPILVAYADYNIAYLYFLRGAAWVSGASVQLLDVSGAVVAALALFGRWMQP